MRQRFPDAEQWSRLSTHSFGHHGAILLTLLRDSMTDFVRLTKPAERSAPTCFSDEVRWRHFANWWVYLARTRELQTLLIALYEGLPNANKVKVATYQAQKMAASAGYG